MTFVCNFSVQLPKCCLKSFEEEEEVLVETFPSLITSSKSRDALKRPTGPQRESHAPNPGAETQFREAAELGQGLCDQVDDGAASTTNVTLTSPPRDHVEPSLPAPVFAPAGAETEPAKRSILGPTVQSFQAAFVLGDDGEVVRAAREPLIQGFECYASVLDKGGNIGSYLIANTKKLRDSKALGSETDYESWMLSELPVHAATRYKEFVDQSAWMGHLWIAWTLEFFVEMFANLSKGLETAPSIDAAYTKTLYTHHNFLQRSAFKAAVKKMPVRSKFYKALQGDAAHDDVVRDMAAFVDLGRPLLRYLLKVSDVVDKRLQAERKAYLNPK